MATAFSQALPYCRTGRQCRTDSTRQSCKSSIKSLIKCSANGLDDDGNNISYLEMTKNNTTDGFYDDGFVYLFNETSINTGYKPKHISYWI